MSSLNRNHIEIAGHLAADPKLKTVKVGDEDRDVCEFRVGVNSYRGREAEPEVTFFPCEAWGNDARTIAAKFTTGSSIFVEGRVRIESVPDKDDNTKKRPFITVLVKEWSFVDSKPKAQ